MNLVVSVSLLALAGFSLFPLVNLALDSGAASATDSNKLSAAQVTQIQAQALGYTQVLQKEPDNQVALKGLLDAKIQLGDIKGTVAPLEKIAALNPQTPDYTVLLAQTKQYLGDREGATTSYRTVLALQPQNINALQGLVSLLLDAKRPEAAVYITQQRNADALAIYNKLIEANKEDFRPVLAKALVFKQMGNLSEAQSMMNTAMGLAPAEYKDQILQLAQATQPPKTTIAPNLSSPAPAPAPVKSPATPQS
jgi:Flp pilus assembly protein TadD